MDEVPLPFGRREGCVFILLELFITVVVVVLYVTVRYVCIDLSVSQE